MRGAAALLLLAAGCASPVDGVWPPQADESTHRIVVSTDKWHSVIGIVQPDGSLEEWGYADKAYFLEGDHGVCGSLSALLIPGAGVIQRRTGTQSWAERTPQPPGASWTFDLTDAGRDRLLAFIHDDVADETPCSHRDGSEWYDSKSSYWMFAHCHHWTAAALREAGLPIWTSYAMFKWSLESQLDRAAEIAADAATPPPRSRSP